MGAAGNPTSAPDPQKLGRSSHLRILTVNFNTVRHPPEGPKGTLTRWIGPDGQCEASFQFEERPLEPHVLNGERIEWINPTNQPCTVIFHKDEVPESPFEKGEREFTINPGQSVFSGVINGKIGGRYRYLVNFAAPPDDDDDENRGDPVIIIKG
jgi:hypothetical protein